MQQDVPGPEGLLALGIDAGGTETRWALAKPPGEIVAEGHVRGFSALDLDGPGTAQVAAILEDLARAVRSAGRPVRVHAGLTGFGKASGDLIQLIADPLGLPAQMVTLGSDIEMAYLDLFAPGQGYLVYAGTGSVAAFMDGDGTLHRAGGRGGLIDDGGGGYWIAREALRQVWRAEDERPGCWRDSPMAQEIFDLVGGADWAHTRQYVYGGSRGDIGRLALAVARAADRDPAARAILGAAGSELARLARAMIGRHGPRPVALSGRAATLHPLIPETMREALPSGTPFASRPCHGDHAAARLALRAATGTPHPALQEREP
ncbi:MAG: BadF/BadG/BcrA/BcrD ATPase family protein [Geothrix sp.]|nr:BadF/BadG/BcrA/BcrD ATPase family protein [Geothrix sp.]